jgi:hypothetical protein
MSAIQEIPVDLAGPQTIRISAWVKTKDCRDGAGINCTQLTGKGQRIGYTSSRQQECLVKRTSNWTRTKLIVPLRSEVRTLEVRSFIYGAGTVWFDDFAIEPFNKNKQPTAAIVTAFTDTVMKIVKANSLYTDSINWKRFADDVKQLQAGMQTYMEARLVANYILGELKRYGDNHSSIMSPAMVKQFALNDVMGQGRR